MNLRLRSPFVVAILMMLAVLPAYLRAVTVAGPSDAPTLLLGDKVLINHAAYEVRFPYTSILLWQRSGPSRGDMVLFQVPNRGTRGLKRVVGLPGDTVAMRQNVLLINGHPVDQELLDRANFQSWVSPQHSLGERVVKENSAYWVTYTPGRSAVSTVATIGVPQGHYYLLGDNRDDSNDSRMFGPVPQSHIGGRMVMHLTSGRPRAMLPNW